MVVGAKEGLVFREREKGFYSIFEALSNHVLECHPWAVDGIGGRSAEIVPGSC
jgi:hypothetical protein